MIKVIIPGSKNRVKCNYCGATLSYQVPDVKKEEKYISQTEYYFIEYIECPQCKSIVEIEEEESNALQTNTGNISKLFSTRTSSNK